MEALRELLGHEAVRRLGAMVKSGRGVSARARGGGGVGGRHRSARWTGGASVEFRQHRFYVPGDDVRRVDWRVLGRTDKVFVREYEDEVNLRCVLVLDASGSMSYGSGGSNKLGWAKRACAGAAYVLLGRGEAAGLATFGGVAGYVPPGAGRAQLSRVVEALDRTEAGGPAKAGVACTAVANRLRRRSMVVVVSDALEDVNGLARGLARLRHDRHEVVLARVLHRDEFEFPFERFVRLLGAEGERGRVVEPAYARGAYLERLADHRRSLVGACAKLGVRVTEFETDHDVVDAVGRLVLGGEIWREPR